MSLIEVAPWLVGTVVGLFVLDRLLLWVESHGWIYYRQNKPGRGASTFHLLEWTSVLDPTQRQVIEIRKEKKQQEDEAGDPVGSKVGGDTPGA